MKSVYFDLSTNNSGPSNAVVARSSAARNRMVHSPRSKHTQLPPLKPLKNVQTMDPKERKFLEAALQGDKPTIHSLLEDQDHPLNVNATDVLGRTALEIAVDNENVEIVDILLKQPNIKIGNALLLAIREGVYKIVEMLINHTSITAEMLGGAWKGALTMQDAENFEYSADISPVILAAHLNRFEILQLLLSRGAYIHRPHSLSCSCQTCEEERSTDSLKHSLMRIYTYRALASPAWISLTSADPILTAFKLSWELQKLSRKECEFKDVYCRLSEQCKVYACDLLTQCRSSEEVVAIMNKDIWSDNPEDIWAAKLSLDRLKLAVKYEQKQFVAHPHCQELLTSIWFEGFPGRRERGSVINKFICLLLILAWPLISLVYILCPKTQLGKIVRSPFMKFLYFSTSFGCFLCLLTLATFEDYRLQKGDIEKGRSAERGPQPTVIESLISVWVFGMLWAEVKQLWDEGLKKYVHQWWNFLDYIMITLYMCSFTLRVVAYFLCRDDRHGPMLIARSEWKAEEPLLIAESLFAVANVFSFARIIYLFQTSPYLGPLQISLGCMLIDICKFFVIFFLVLTSFAIGLAQLYWYYSNIECPNGGKDSNCKTNSEAFSSIANSYTTLLWSLFSITKTEDTEVRESHEFTELIGRGMYIAYHVSSIIVLLNMLIAMMSHSFQTINRPGGYQRKPTVETSTVPQIEVQELLTYQDIMRRIVSRYIHQTKKDIKMDGVNEDDLLEIKQDISSLRFELREERRKEVARSSTHIDGVKHEILRSLSTAGPRPSYLSSKEDIAENEVDNVELANRKKAVSVGGAVDTVERLTIIPAGRRKIGAIVGQRAKDLEKVKNDIVQSVCEKLEKEMEKMMENFKESIITTTSSSS